MKEFFFWVYVASALLVFLYLFVFSILYMIPVFRECERKGMVRVKKPTNWGKICVSLLQCALMIGIPIVNTFFAVVWVCSTNQVEECWEGMAWECYCYPDELP